MGKTINILGATGSIGQSTADVILSSPEMFKVQVVTANSNAKALAERAVELGAKHAVIADETHYGDLKDALSGADVKVSAGNDALIEAAGMAADITMAAIMGIAGLKPLVAAIEHSDVVAIANKEPLVSAGPQVMQAAKDFGTALLPVDSEHNAIFQVFDFDRRTGIERIILTASGGPFRTWSKDDIDNATPAQALKHPNWSMGRKITIDSATLMNKGLEIIEAHHLFGMPADKIDVVIHPQSIIHSLVEYADGSMLAQLGANDMRTPISYALAWPERMKTPGERLDLAAIGSLDFETPDRQRFPALQIAYDCMKSGQAHCIVMNAANEVIVESFLTNNIRFGDMMPCIVHVLEQVDMGGVSSLDDIKALDENARTVAIEFMNEQTTKTTVST